MRIGGLLVLGLVAPGAVVGDTIGANFGTHTYDEAKFVARPGTDGGCWDLQGAGLRAKIPAERPGQASFEFRSRFTLGGDFEAAVAYTLAEFPRREDDPAPEPAAMGPIFRLALLDTIEPTSVYRAAHPAGASVGFEANSPDGRRQRGERAVASRRGRLGFRRVGDRLTFLASGSAGAWVELGTIEISPSLTPRIALEVLPIGTSEVLDVQFDRLDIRADRLSTDAVGTGPPQSWAREPTGSDPLAWLGTVGGAVVGGIGLVRRSGAGTIPSQPRDSTSAGLTERGRFSSWGCWSDRTGSSGLRR